MPHPLVGKNVSHQVGTDQEQRKEGEQKRNELIAFPFTFFYGAVKHVHIECAKDSNVKSQ